MISLIIKSYLTILISIGFGAISLFSLGIYMIYRYFYGNMTVIDVNEKPVFAPVPLRLNESIDITPHELASIAGNDLISTQLDLARAYIEINNHSAAVKLLESICQQGSDLQQSEAKKLLNHISDFQFVQRVQNTSG